jgi:gas vesicle protein
MKLNNRWTNSFLTKRNSEMTTIAIISGITIGVAVVALFATDKGKVLRKKFVDRTTGLLNQLTGNTKEKANAKLGSLITDVSSHIKKNAEGLL